MGGIESKPFENYFSQMPICFPQNVNITRI